MTDQTSAFVASPDPDPSIAPNEPADQPADRWVRYLGDAPVTVIDAGEWQPDDARLVPGWLAVRLLRNPAFVEATDPATAPPAASADPAETSAADEDPKPQPTRRRATPTTTN